MIKARDINAIVENALQIQTAEYEVKIKDAYEKGREDREKEIIENINSYINMLIKALNDKTENPILHEALASKRADEIRIRKLIMEQLNEPEREINTEHKRGYNPYQE